MEVERAAALSATGFDHLQQRFDEAAAVGALVAKGETRPDQRVTQNSPGRKVRRRHIIVMNEQPQILRVVEQLAAGGRQRGFRVCGAALWSTGSRGLCSPQRPPEANSHR